MNAALQTAKALTPLLEAQQQQPNTEKPYQLRSDLVAALHKHKVLRSLLPIDLGGAEQSLPEFLTAIKHYAEIDASSAWCINQGAIAASLTCWLPTQTQQHLWAHPAAALANGAPVSGSAHWDGDVLRVSGHWMFASGYHHVTHLAGAVRLANGSGWQMIFVPKAAVQVEDNWQTQGLRATGSIEFRLEDHPVPAAWVADMRKPCQRSQPLFRLPTGQCFAVGFAALAQGIARAALNDCIALAQHKQPLNSSGGLSNDINAQRLMGEAQSRLQAAELLVEHSTDTAWKAAQTSKVQTQIDEQHRVNLRMAGTHGLREAVAVMQLAWQIAGTSGIYQRHPLHQRHQDMAVASQHAQGRASHYAWLGRYQFGGSYEPGPLN